MDKLPVFVYGTLKSGYGNHRLLVNRFDKGEPDYIIGKMHDIGGIPMVSLPEDPDLCETRVFGEVYYIKPELYEDVISRLDRLEGYVEGSGSNFYEREIITTCNGVRCYIYVARPGRSFPDETTSDGQVYEYVGRSVILHKSLDIIPVEDKEDSNV